jgi:hypothetical protein
MSFQAARKLARQTTRELAREAIGDFSNLTRQEVADALNVSIDTLERMHHRNDAPPRFRAGLRIWAYPAGEFRKWRETRMEVA